MTEDRIINRFEGRPKLMKRLRGEGGKIRPIQKIRDRIAEAIEES